MPGGRPDDAYSIEPLAANHDRVAFACGQSALDRYLREQARHDAKRSVAATFVAVPRDTKAVAGYYALAATSVDVGELPPAVAAKLPRYSTLPATLLGRLAVDQRHQGCGLGEYLLVHALRRSLTASREIGALAVIVDAIDGRAYAFYKRYEFVPFPDQSRRLFLPMQSIVRLFGEKT